MFYSHDILQKRGGRFGTIWIAATKGVALSKRDYCGVCVPKSCDEIVNIIMAGEKRGTRQRFSLYLSSQLMVGVARVFEKQVSYFIVDVHELHKRTTRLTAGSFDDVVSTHIQLKKSARSADFCTMPESSLFLDEEFGVIRGSLDTSPDPFLLPQIELFSVSPYRSAKLSTSLLQLSPAQMDKLVMESPPHMVSSADEISLREEPSIYEEIQIPEMDLPPLEGMADIMSDMEREEPQDDDKEINLSLVSDFGLDQLWAVDEQTGQLILSPSPKGPPLPLPRDSSSPAGSPLELLQVCPVPSQAAILSPTGSQVEQDIPGDEPMETEGVELWGDEAEPKKVDHGLETPAVGTMMADILQLSPIEPHRTSPARRRGRKRRLVFMDDTKELSKRDIRRNMETVKNLERKDVVIPLKYPSAKELMEEPARKALKQNSTLSTLWKSRSQLRRSRPDKEGEDWDAPAWSTAYMRPRTAQNGSTTDTTSKEDQEQEPDLDLEDGDDQERRDLVQQIPEVLRHEVSISPERLRVTSFGSTEPRPKFEDTPRSFVVSDASHLSESKDSSAAKSFHSESSAHRSSHHPTRDSLREMEEAIPEELVDMRELPLLPEEDIILEEPILEEAEIPSAPEMISTSEDEEGKKRRSCREKKSIPQDNVLRGIEELMGDSDSISFRDLVPVTTYKPVAAKIFSVCLEYAGLKLITLNQEGPYADIIIHRAAAFLET